MTESRAAKPSTLALSVLLPGSGHLAAGEVAKSFAIATAWLALIAVL